ncbi:transposase [Deinococcus peraridilitoris]|uniref:transposase n=1 Tax=Deinococcus peraridilitoris TaxID=432329 RepID=UPI0002FE8D54|nr:transposase [Deinococcus peraridilitoris]
MTVSWVWLYRNAVPEQRFVMTNRVLGGVHLARIGKRRWKIEAFFKTIKGRFGLERFAQSRKQGAFCFWCLSTLAFLLCHLADLDLPSNVPGAWPDWGERALGVRLTLLADVRRAALLLELARLDAVQNALLAASP